MTTVQTIKSFISRDLNKLKTEISLYQHETALWVIDANIANSAGNLCLHLIGNLNFFIGLHLGNTGYVRNRDLEFSAKNIPRGELLQQLDSTIAVVEKTLDTISDDQLLKDYPIPVFEATQTMGYMLIHLATHLGYHLGQVNYHRRMLDK